eukprot:2637471-Rhodomonas_salina.4
MGGTWAGAGAEGGEAARAHAPQVRDQLPDCRSRSPPRPRAAMPAPDTAHRAEEERLKLGFGQVAPTLSCYLTCLRYLLIIYAYAMGLHFALSVYAICLPYLPTLSAYAICLGCLFAPRFQTTLYTYVLCPLYPPTTSLHAASSTNTVGVRYQEAFFYGVARLCPPGETIFPAAKGKAQTQTGAEPERERGEERWSRLTNP